MSGAVSLLAIILAGSIVPQDTTPLPNPFAGIETIELSNGLKVWYKRLTEARNVSISIAIPVGRDADPIGKEQLAHFTEHMLFSDHLGRSEEEIKREIDELGGDYNAAVSDDRTFYFVRVGKEHGLFALEWLYRIVAPHGMDPEVVEKQRAPVALEIRARPRQFFDWMWAYYVYPPALRPNGFWEREFGLRTLADRDYYAYASLNAITPEDLRTFYETYYTPSSMTLTVIGDLDRDEVMEAIEKTFGRLPPRGAPVRRTQLRDPGRYRQTVFWAYRSNVFYRSRFKLYSPRAEENLLLIFVAQLLGKRLNDQLRFGEDKSTYGIRSRIVHRGPATYLEISGGIEPQRYDDARRAIETEIERLRTADLPRDEFEADRNAIARQLRVASYSPAVLESWVRREFYDRSVHEDFPDLVTLFDTVSQSRVQSFAADHLVSDRHVVTIVHPHPITQGVLALLIAALVWLTIATLRSRLIREVEMSRIRYVARFRMPPLLGIVATLGMVGLIGIGGRLLFFLYQQLTLEALVTLDSFFLQWSAYGLMLASAVAAVLLVRSRLPRKVLVFEDRVLIKYRSYRTVELPLAELDEIGFKRFVEVWLSKRIWRTTPLAFGLFAPAVYLGRPAGRSYYFNVRDPDELISVVNTLKAASRSDRISPSPPLP